MKSVQFLLVSLFSVLLSINAAELQESQASAASTIQAIPFDATVKFEVHNPLKQYNKIKCLMLTLSQHHTISQIAKVMQFDIEFSDQIAVELNKATKALEPATLQKLFKQGTSLCLYIEDAPATNDATINLKISLKDTASEKTLFQKKYNLLKTQFVHDAHKIAADLMPVLTGEAGPILSTLAYCKEVASGHKIICLADYACKVEKPVITTKTINTAPAWHSSKNGLCYSQFTRSNCRLMYYDLETKVHKSLCSYTGMNMMPSFSPDGTQVALCLSHQGNTEIFLYDEALCKKMQRKVFLPLTNNKGNNSSPCLLPNGDLVFCSDYLTGSPQIYYRNNLNQTVKCLTSGKGYRAAPSYCAKTNMITYTRYTKGSFQLYCLDLAAQKPREKQLTFSAGDKVDPSWSECGKYIAFTSMVHDQAHKKNVSQIAVFNTMSGSVRTLTSTPEHKSFPVWTGKNLFQLKQV
jgi:tol-pal system beta propeller repeat protein TolB